MMAAMRIVAITSLIMATNIPLAQSAVGRSPSMAFVVSPSKPVQTPGRLYYSLVKRTGGGAAESLSKPEEFHDSTSEDTSNSRSGATVLGSALGNVLPSIQNNIPDVAKMSAPSSLFNLSPSSLTMTLATPAVASAAAFASFFTLTSAMRALFGLDDSHGGLSGTAAVKMLMGKKLTPASATAFQRIFLPSLSLLLGGMTSFTMGILQGKRMGLAALLQEEASCIENIFVSLKKLFRDDPTRMAEATKLLRTYTAAAARDVGLKQGKSPNDPEISPKDLSLASTGKALHQQGLDTLAKLRDLISNVTPKDLESHSFETFGKSAENQILQVQGELAQLREIRGKRGTSLKPGFPQEHYLLLLTLATTQLSAFLFDNINETFDPSKVSLCRYAFGVIVGLYSWLGMRIVDMKNPWVGKYSVVTDSFAKSLKVIERQGAPYDGYTPGYSSTPHMTAQNKKQK